MRYTTYLTLFLMFLMIGCSPKVQEATQTEPVEIDIEDSQEDIEVEEDDSSEESSSTNCTRLEDLNGALREQTEIAYVLYRDQLKLNNYNEAYKLWKQAFYNAPAATGNIKYQYEDGIKIYKEFYNKSQDPELKAAYVDTVMMIYDRRVECFGEPSYVAGRKAFDLFYSFPETVSTDSIFSLFKQSIDGKKQKTDYFVVNPFTKILTDKVFEESIAIEEARYYAKLILEVIELGNNSGKNPEAWSIINAYAPSRLENLEGIKDFYDCDYYLDKYYKLYVSDSLNCEVINTAYSRMLWGACSKDNEVVHHLATAKENHCYTPPPPPGTLRLAYDAYSEGNYNDAISLFNKFVEETDDVEKKYKYSLLVAKIYYADIKNFVKSRQYAMQASEYDPKAGEPYLLIGKLYASSGPLCGPGRGWDSQIVTWPAIDMFEIAAKDPLVRSEANQLIRTYWQYMPKKEDIFQRTIKAGSSFKVNCWINRTTTVRTAD